MNLRKKQHTFLSTVGTTYLPFHQGIPYMCFYQRYSIHSLLSQVQHTFPSIRVFHTFASIRDTAYIPFYHRDNKPSLPSGYSIHLLLSEIQHTFPSIIGLTYLPFHQGIPYMRLYHRYNLPFLPSGYSKIHTCASIKEKAYIPFYHRYSIPSLPSGYSIHALLSEIQHRRLGIKDKLAAKKPGQLSL